MILILGTILNIWRRNTEDEDLDEWGLEEGRKYFRGTSGRCKGGRHTFLLMLRQSITMSQSKACILSA